MAAPTRYSLTYDFTGFQSANPNTPLPADKIEIEFNNIGLSIGETITNLGLIQRSDGKLQNKIVGFDALDDATKALLGTTINPRGDWAASTAYKVLDLVTVGESTYIAVADHASGTSFTVDLTANKWQLWANPGFVDGTSFFQKFSGNGSTTAFTVSQDMGTDENGLMIFINNSGWIPQDPANFTINGTTLTFLSAPPNGTNNIFVFAPAKILSQAAAYATAAGTSASGAAASASSASASASTASTAATAAAASEDAAATSETNAANSATAAQTAETNAETAETNAETAQAAAATSASQASTSATNADNSATAAAGSASTASSAATTATGAAATASTAATNAGNSATAAAASASAAAASAASVPLHVFNKTVDPLSTDDSGDGYSVGSIWVNTTSDTSFICVDATLNAAIWDNMGGGLGDATVFSPVGKYSPLKMQATDGWANGQPDTGTPATHDASAGDIPSYTTAKKRSICIVTVAGTLGSVTLSKGDLLMALQDNPTTALHWSAIRESQTEFDAAVVAAQGSPVALYGTFLLNMANADAAINLTGDYTILNKCGYSAIYQTSNNTRAGLQTPRAVASAGTGVATGIDVDDEIGTTLQHVSYFVLGSAAHAADFHLNQMVEVFTDAVHVAFSGGSKGYISNAFRVTSIDANAGIIYADRVVKYHNKIANASNIVLIPLHEDRAITIRPGAHFMGAPTIIGGEVGWWQTLDGSVPIAGTISGSGSTRTITYTGPNLDYIALQGIRMGLVSGVPEASCKISSFNYSGGVNTLVVSVSSSNDKGQAWTAPTSGTVYFVPAFWTNEFNTTTHGGMIIAQQAHGSQIDVEVSRLWSSAVRLRFSHFNNVKVRPRKVINTGTGISGKSWRLTYMVETYSACRNEISVDVPGFGAAGRHAYTSSSGDTSTTWASTHWQFRSGCTCENRVRVRTTCDTGAACDTHAMTNGDQIDSEVEFPTTFNTAHSYRGLGAQLRSENTNVKHRQRGGNIGLRIANGADYVREPGSVDEIDLECSDMPLRDDQHGFSGGLTSQMACGFLMMRQDSYTDKTLVVGRMHFKNAGCGFVFEESTNGKLSEITHQDVGYAGGWIKTGANVYVSEMNLDYSIAAGKETTSSSSVALGTGTKTFTVPSSLTDMGAGRDILLQDNTSAANARTNYMWGRIVSYSGTTLVVYIQGYVGTAATYSSWLITAGATKPRFGIVLQGTCAVNIGVLRWKVGEGANPLEIFHSKDSAATKTVTAGIIIIDDPLNKGMPALFTSGRATDFVLTVGIMIYNGVIIRNRSPYFPLTYRSGKYYGPTITSASWSTLALSANTQYFVPIFISQPATFSGISMYQTSTGSGSTNLRVGLYKDNGGVPGTLVAGTDTADTGEAVAGKIDVAFAAAVTIGAPGWYWLSILTDAAITITATSNLAQTGCILYGAEDIGANSTGTGLQPTVASVTYGALPVTAGTLAYGSTGTNTIALFLKAS